MTTTPGKAIFLNKTGHSIHNERRDFFADEVSDFLGLGGRAGSNEDWTRGPYWGSRGTFFADVTGDGLADAIVVNDDRDRVRRSTGAGFRANEDWTHGPYFGSRGTFFADVTGDGSADAIVVNDDTRDRATVYRRWFRCQRGTGRGGRTGAAAVPSSPT